MALTLPEELTWVLDILGFEWPKADEDQLHACAQAWRDFANRIDQMAPRGSSAAAEVTGSNSGDAIDAFRKEWGAFDGSAGGSDNYFRDAKAAAEVIALAFDVAAAAILAAKIAVIVQLVMLAAEIIAAQAEAVFTFGLSEIGGLAATGLTRAAVREILQKLRQEVMRAATKAMEHATMDALKKVAKKLVSKEARKMALDYGKKVVKEEVKERVVEGGKKFVQDGVVGAAKDEAIGAGADIAGNLAAQGIENHFGARHGIDWSETGDIVKEHAGSYVDDVKKAGKEYVDGVKDLGDPQTYVDHVTKDADSYANTQADRAQGHVVNRLDQHTGGHASRVVNALGDQGEPAQEGEPAQGGGFSAYEEAKAVFG
ncbi:PE-PGRS family protein [Streptomyces sp. NPDC059740]|uniref:WXG100-like domain-containing protein n=1 Tax=Streptomyces sp. NPDC059740 TaxID=3346926 RepID=UPI003660E443